MTNKEYILEEDQSYLVKARANPIGNAHYSIPVHSNVTRNNPLHSLLERLSLDVARQIAEKTGQNVIITLTVEKEKTD